MEIAQERSQILAHIRRNAVTDSDSAVGAILALGNCGNSADINTLERRATELKTEVIDPYDKKAQLNRQALLYLINHSVMKIKKRSSN